MKSDKKDNSITIFGLTEDELIEYRALMQMPEDVEDESIDSRILELKRLRQKRLNEMSVVKSLDKGNANVNEKVNKIRITKVLRELNISLDRAVDFLKQNGFIIISNPSTVINDQEYLLLKSRFLKNEEIKYNVEISYGSTKIKFELQNPCIDFYEDESIKFFAKEVFSILNKLNDTNIKLKKLGRKSNNYFYNLNNTLTLKVISKNTIIIQNLEFSFNKILNLEKSSTGSGIDYLINLISNKKSLNDSVIYETYEIEKYSKKNPFQEEIINILKKDYANGKIVKKVDYNNLTLESQFSDFQAFHICKGLKNQNYLYNKFIDNKLTDEDVFLAHNLANKLLKDKGKKMIDFILTLPSLPFKNNQFKILFSTLDKIRLNGKNENPTIRLSIPTEEGTNDDIEFSFYSINGKKYINEIIARNKNKKTDVFSVTRDCLVLPKTNLSSGKNLNTTPILQFFYHISKSAENFNQAVLGYGIESGNCSVCGRPLNDEKSKLKGIGPICEKYL